MDDSHLLNLTPERFSHRVRQHRYRVFAPFPDANHDLSPVKLDIMYPQPQALEQAQARAIQQARHQVFRSGELVEQSSDLGDCENHRQATWLFRPSDIVEPGQLALKYFPIKKKNALGT